MIDTALRNRQPLNESAFAPLPLGAVRLTGPEAQQTAQAVASLLRAIDAEEGLFAPDSAWLGGESYGPDMSAQLLTLAMAACFSGDETLLSQLRRYMNRLLDTAQPQGGFGPGQADLYDHALCCRVMAHYYTTTGERRVLAVMAQYFYHLAQTLEQQPLSERDPLLLCELLEPMLWLYNLAGYPFLRRLSAQISRLSQNWTGHFTSFGYTRDLKQAMPAKDRDPHSRAYALTDGAYNAAAVKYPALLHAFLGGNQNADAPGTGLKRMIQYHGQPQGLFSCDDHFSGLSPCAGVSTRALMQAADSLVTLSALSGDGSFADAAEQIAFNALPGAFSKDLAAMQPYGCANQVDAGLNAAQFYNPAPEGLLFAPAPAADLSAFFQLPRLMAMRSADGIALLSYLDARVNWVIGGVPVRITVEGGYPINSAVTLTVRTKKPVRFALSLRVPGWAQGATLTLEGAQTALQPGAYHKIDRVWDASVVLSLSLPMNLRSVSGFRQSVSVYRGPLLMALPLTEQKEDQPSGSYALHTDDPWAFALSAKALAQLDALPTAEGAIQIPGVPVSWAMLGSGAAAPPVLPEATGAQQTLRLVPFGQTRLRISRFPVYQDE